MRPCSSVLGRTRKTRSWPFAHVSASVSGSAATKRTLFCFAQSETARPTFDRNVPEIRATFSDATSSCACFWASAGWPLSSRKMTSILRPSTPPFALTSSTAVPSPCRYGPVNGAPMPLNEVISPILIGACCVEAGAAVARTTMVASTPRTRCRLIASLPVVRLNVGPKHGEVKRGAPCRSRARLATAVVDSPHDEARARRRRPRRAAGRSSTRRVLAPRARRRPHGQGSRGGDAQLPPAGCPPPPPGDVDRRLLRRGLGLPGRRHRRAERRQAVRRARRQGRGGLGARARARPPRRRARPRAPGGG